VPAEKTPYDNRHRVLRKRWERKLEAAWAKGEEFICTRPGCNRPIGPFEPWDLGHKDGSKTEYNGPEHASCNRTTSHRGVKRFSREW
jgi:hypothetical protein